MKNWSNRIVSYGTEDPEDLLPNERNSRIHGQDQQRHMEAALDDVGWVQDVIVNLRTSDEWPAGQRGIKTLCDGHLRVKLALRHEVHQVPVKYVDLTPRQEAVVLASFDAITGEASIDSEMLAMLLEDAQSDNADMQQFLAKMAEDAGIVPEDGGVEDVPPQIDKADELRKKWGTETGQLWQLGEHRLLCGDSTKREDVERVLDGKQYDFLITSPPYNVGVAYDSHEDTNVGWDQYSVFLKSVLEPAVEWLLDGRSIAWNIGTSPKTNHVRQHLLLESLGLTYYRQMVWKKVGVPFPLWFNTKNNPVARQFTPNYTHEIVIVFTKGDLEKGEQVAIDPLCENDVFEFAQNMATVDLPEGKTRTGAQSNLDRRSNKAHPAAFPIRIPAMFISHLAGPGELVYEPFLGSGTTLIACEQLNRKCRAIEISPAYVAVALQRWADATGKEPKLLK